MITENINQKLYNMFVNDPFNWKNSRYQVYSSNNDSKSEYKKLVWTPGETKDIYVKNSMGYRSDEFAETRDIIFAGCSNTWGEGVMLDGIWGNILSKSLNKKSYNLGIGSKSTQFIVQNTIAFCKEYGNPKVIFCLFPEFIRIQMKSDTTFMVGKNAFSGAVGRQEYSLVPNKINPEKNIKYSKSPHLAEEMIPSELLFSINLDYVRMLELYCKLNNIKLFWGTWDMSQDEYLHKNIGSMDFKNYVYLEQEKWNRTPDNRYRDLFYKNGIANDGDNISHTDCHQEYKEKYGMNFDFPMDGDPKSGLPGVKVITGHMAVHKHIHIAEMFEEALKNACN